MFLLGGDIHGLCLIPIIQTGVDELRRQVTGIDHHWLVDPAIQCVGIYTALAEPSLVVLQ